MLRYHVVAWALAVLGWGVLVDFFFLPGSGLFDLPHERCEMAYPDPDFEGQAECLWLLIHPTYYD